MIFHYYWFVSRYEYVGIAFQNLNLLNVFECVSRYKFYGDCFLQLEFIKLLSFDQIHFSFYCIMNEIIKFRENWTDLPWVNYMDLHSVFKKYVDLLRFWSSNMTPPSYRYVISSLSLLTLVKTFMKAFVLPFYRILFMLKTSSFFLFFNEHCPLIPNIHYSWTPYIFWSTFFFLICMYGRIWFEEVWLSISCRERIAVSQGAQANMIQG